jgi:hypothetical protein
MDTIKINVNKQLDGFNFSIAPSIREMIRSWFPNARPANNIFVEYDTKSDFENNYSRLETFIYPALLGVENQAELKKKVKEILFVDTQTGNVLHSLKLLA